VRSFSAGALMSLALSIAITGCGGKSNPLDNPALMATTSTLGEMEAERWNAYTRSEQAAYRSAFNLCNGWVDTASPTFDPTKASDYQSAHQGTATGDGCADGIAGLPLAGSGIQVPH
jgi:hypothetical protein